MFEGYRTYMASSGAILAIVAAVLQNQMTWQNGLVAALLALSQIYQRAAKTKGNIPTILPEKK